MDYYDETLFTNPYLNMPDNQQYTFEPPPPNFIEQFNQPFPPPPPPYNIPPNENPPFNPHLPPPPLPTSRVSYYLIFI